MLPQHVLAVITAGVNYRYCLHYNPTTRHRSYMHCLQLILNSSAPAVSKTPKFAHISPVLKSLHWLEIEQRIHYKVASITYKVLQPEQPSYLHSLLNVQSNRTTRSSDVITLQRLSVRSRLKLTDRSFTRRAPVLWNSL